MTFEMILTVCQVRSAPKDLDAPGASTHGSGLRASLIGQLKPDLVQERHIDNTSIAQGMCLQYAQTGKNACASADQEIQLGRDSSA